MAGNNNDVIDLIINNQPIVHGRATIKGAGAVRQEDYLHSELTPGAFSGDMYGTGNIINRYDGRFDDPTYYTA